MTESTTSIQVTRQEIEALAIVLNAASEEYELSSEDEDEDREYESAIYTSLDLLRKAIDKLSIALPT